MADLYLTPAERYTAALGGFYYGDLPNYSCKRAFDAYWRLC